MTRRRYLLIIAALTVGALSIGVTVLSDEVRSTAPKHHVSQAAQDAALAAEAYAGLTAVLAQHPTTAQHPTARLTSCAVSHTSLTLARAGLGAAHITGVHAGTPSYEISRWRLGTDSGLALACLLGGDHQVALAAVTHRATVVDTYLRGWRYITTSHGGTIYSTLGDTSPTTCNATWIAPNKRYVLSLQFDAKRKTPPDDCGAALGRIHYAMEKSLATYAPRPPTKH